MDVLFCTRVFILYSIAARRTVRYRTTHEHTQRDAINSKRDPEDGGECKTKGRPSIITVVLELPFTLLTLTLDLDFTMHSLHFQIKCFFE